MIIPRRLIYIPVIRQDFVMEQVSGGSGIPTKTKFCSNCEEITIWISLRGVWTCGKCARNISGNPVVL